MNWNEVLPDVEDEDLFDEYNVLPEFEKEFKALHKKWDSLAGDLRRFIEGQLQLYHIREIDNRGTFELTYVDPKECSVYKSKKFACMDLGGGSYSGIRIIHAYDPDSRAVELVEIYYRGDRENEDRERVKRYYG